jgi:DNA-binding NarL/FixJ family response regulator
VLNYSAIESQESEVIATLLERKNRVIVLHRVPNIKKAKALLSRGVQGYGNALMKPHFLLSAVDAIEEGMVWLHPEFTSALIMEIPQERSEDISTIISVLSQREKEVVYLLKDGLTYNKIALALSITPRTVKAHAHSIYSKLQVKDRVSLALLLK